MKLSLKRILFVVLVLIAIGAFEYAEHIAIFNKQNQDYLKFLIGNASSKFEAPMVTLVRVDDSQKELFSDNGWPPSQLDWGVILMTLEKKDPEAVGIVSPLKFEERDSISQGVLQTMVLKLPRLTLGVPFGAPGEGTVPIDPAKFLTLDLAGVPAPAAEGAAPAAAAAPAWVANLPEAQAMVTNTEEEFLVNGRLGFTHIELKEEMTSGPNGLRVPLLARAGDKVVASFALQMVMTKAKYEPADVSITMGPKGGTIQLNNRKRVAALRKDLQAFRQKAREAKDAPKEQVEQNQAEIARREAEIKTLDSQKSLTIPVDTSAQLLVYPGSRMEVPSLTAAQLVLSGSEFGVAEELNKDSEKALNSIDKNAVLIGFDNADAKQFKLLDGTDISRTELLAMAVATMQGGLYVRYWPAVIRYIVFGGLIFAGVYLMGTRRMYGFLGGFLVLFFYNMIAAMLVFKSSLTWTPPFTAFAICLVIMLVSLIPRTDAGAARRKKLERVATAPPESVPAPHTPPAAQA